MNTYHLMRAIRGPLMLMALGTLMCLHRFQEISFAKTWPALLILLGILKLAERMTIQSPSGQA
ncbi:MAG: hypothetical protein HY821_14745 [Acidobacteria bacterium]|nr:hypothetical protein [Acidobacteriota bacterium]